MDDAESSICCGCGAPFTLLLRRHHCRRCGRLLCHGCSAMKSALPSDELAEGGPAGPAAADAQQRQQPAAAARWDADEAAPTWRVCCDCHQEVLLAPLARWGSDALALRPLTAAEGLASLRGLSAVEWDALHSLDVEGSVTGSLTQRWLASDGSAYHMGEIVPTELVELTAVGASDEGSVAAGRSGADVSEADEAHQALRGAWGAALLAADPTLAELRFLVVPAAVPENVFWRRYWRLAWASLRQESLSLAVPRPEVVDDTVEVQSGGPGPRPGRW